jgi:hypothetical protein
MNSIVKLILVSTILLACTYDKVPKRKYITENVILLVIDGPRYSETFGDSFHTNIPEQYALLDECLFVNDFYNLGETFTVPGHNALISGFYENIANNGTQFPGHKSVINYWLSHTSFTSNDASIIASKDKLQVLAGNSTELNKIPFTDCGISGLGSGYRVDSITHLHVMNKLQSSTQRCMLINYLGPDVKGHLGDSIAYINAIKETDLYVKEIWSFIQSDARYKDKTTLIVTNDHGRHLNGVSSGFISHGDNCLGCRRIQLQIFSPDVQKGTTCYATYDQLNIAATMAELLQVPEFNSENGLTPMSAIFK